MLCFLTVALHISSLALLMGTMYLLPDVVLSDTQEMQEMLGWCSPHYILTQPTAGQQRCCCSHKAMKLDILKHSTLVLDPWIYYIQFLFLCNMR